MEKEFNNMQLKFGGTKSLFPIIKKTDAKD